MVPESYWLGYKYFLIIRLLVCRTTNETLYVLLINYFSRKDMALHLANLDMALHLVNQGMALHLANRGMALHLVNLDMELHPNKDSEQPLHKHTDHQESVRRF